MDSVSKACFLTRTATFMFYIRFYKFFLGNSDEESEEGSFKESGVNDFKESGVNDFKVSFGQDYKFLFCVN